MKTPEPRNPNASNKNESIKEEVEEEAQRLQTILAKLRGQNFYERIGLTREASTAEIESMRFLLTVFDPAKKSINLRNVCEQISALYGQAFDTLSDPSKREEYDESKKTLKQ